MDSHAYEQFTGALRSALEADERVLGLVAVGSMAGRDYGPDRFSDHDFLVIVRPGAQEDFRRTLDWLPESGRLALWFRETAHGLKALFHNGHLLEFAIFDPEEIHLARVNRYRVLLDRGGVTEALAAIAARTARESVTSGDEPWLLGQFVTHLLVGLGRHIRGEGLSGRSFVKASALRHLVVLLARHVPAEQKALLDDLDPFRRFERVFPDLGRELNEVLERPTPLAVRGLLDLAERELKGRIAGFPDAAVAAVRAQLNALAP